MEYTPMLIQYYERICLQLAHIAMMTFGALSCVFLVLVTLPVIFDKLLLLTGYLREFKLWVVYGKRFRGYLRELRKMQTLLSDVAREALLESNDPYIRDIASSDQRKADIASAMAAAAMGIDLPKLGNYPDNDNEREGGK